jgi:formate dehydrogenase major subunit
MAIIEKMHAGEVKGAFAWGQNFAVGGPKAGREREALDKLDWLVAIDIFETETAAFWKRPGVNPSSINTEVFLLPAANSYEKEGTIANSGRWIQWRYQAVEPPGQAKSDLWIADELFKRIRGLYASEGGAFPDPILEMNWDYGTGEPDIAQVAAEINGYDIASGSLFTSFGSLKNDGTTACGCWIYCGYYESWGNPACKRRDFTTDPGGTGLFPSWAFAWPLNRRIIYNRCSCDPAGNPWNPDLWIVRWNGSSWETRDVPDFGAGTTAPSVTAQAPFIMLGPERQGRLFAAGMAEGPFPEHYEPKESPVSNALNNLQNNPCLVVWGSDFAAVGDPNYPYICSTYRVSEHWQSGIMTRNCPWLNELMPNMFVEISTTLASAKCISNGDMVEVSTVRGAITAIACVTNRLQPLNGVEVIGMPWHWGYAGMSQGPSANMLTAHVGDANTSIPEYKAFLANIRKVG